jgi:hypothetical protein
MTLPRDRRELEAAVEARLRAMHEDNLPSIRAWAG